LLALTPSDRPVILEIAAPNFDTSKHYGSWAERLWRRLQKRAIRHLARHRLAAINVYSDSHAIELRRQLDLPDSFPIQVTADSRSAIKPSISKFSARLRLGLPPDATVYLFYGTLRRDKGLSTLLEAFAQTPPKCHLMIAGKPLDLDPPAVDGPRITTRYDFIPDGETEIYFAAADALVLPYEPFYSGSSGPLFDACAYGLPVIASDVSEMGELVRAYALGFTTTPGDVPSLAAALSRFHDLNDATRAQYALSGRLFLESTSTYTVAANYLALYESLTNVSS
jgi:glycosyltransferase involved in cell wall biosynthesis